MFSPAETLLLHVRNEHLAEALYHAIGTRSLSVSKARALMARLVAKSVPAQKMPEYYGKLASSLMHRDSHYEDQLREIVGPVPDEEGEEVRDSFERSRARVYEFVRLISA